MKKNIQILLIVVLVMLYFPSGSSAFEITWQDISGGNLDLKAVLVSPGNPSLIYIGSRHGVLKSEDGGASWRNILLAKGKNKTINFISTDPLMKDSLYAAGGGGLFYSPNQGRDWKRIFRGKNFLESECTVLTVLAGKIYLGTKGGLFISKDKGQRWHKEAGKLGNSHILSIAASDKDPQYVYVACAGGVYKTKNKGESWERIFVAHTGERENYKEEESEDKDEEERFSDIRYISIDADDTNDIYLATSRGIYKSEDGGENWKTLTDYGLLSRSVNFLLVSGASVLYAAAKSGVFDYKGERWREISLGLQAEEVRCLSLDNKGNMYAACNKGLFKAKIGDYTDDRSRSLISLYSKNEPSINEVHKAAIKYAEVEPEKIMRWRKQAAKRAWLPKLTLGMDRDRNRTISSSIWGTSGTNSSPGKYYIGPDDETTYNNINWNISLTWELGDLVWSGDQTSIDVRSRLMVELRSDILDEVTKLYFERLRVKAELNNLSIEERKKRFEKEIRLQELSASLDALTGGYFSRP